MCKSAWKPPLVSTEWRKGKSVAFPDRCSVFFCFLIRVTTFKMGKARYQTDETGMSMSCNSASGKYSDILHSLKLMYNVTIQCRGMSP